MEQNKSVEEMNVPLASKEKGPSRKKRKSKPKGYPKRPLSAYNVFFRETRDKLMSSWKEGGGKEDEKLGFTSMGQAIADRWRALDAEGRKRFEELAKKDMARYREEVKNFEQEEAEKKRKIELATIAAGDGEIDASSPMDRQAEALLNTQKTIFPHGGHPNNLAMAALGATHEAALGNITGLLNPGTALHQQDLSIARRILGLRSTNPAVLPNLSYNLPTSEGLARRPFNQEGLWQRQRLLEELRLVEAEGLRAQQLRQGADSFVLGQSHRLAETLALDRQLSSREPVVGQSSRDLASILEKIQRDRANALLGTTSSALGASLSSPAAAELILDGSGRSIGQTGRVGSFLQTTGAQGGLPLGASSIMGALAQGARLRHPVESLVGVASTATTEALGLQVTNDTARQMILEEYARRIRGQGDTASTQENAPAPP